MVFIAYTLPIVPGQSERAGNFRAELNPAHEAHYEELNRRAKIRRRACFARGPESDRPSNSYRAERSPSARRGNPPADDGGLTNGGHDRTD